MAGKVERTPLKRLLEIPLPLAADDALSIIDVDNITGADEGFDLLCLEPGCYNVTVAGGTSSFEIGWELRDANAPFWLLEA